MELFEVLMDSALKYGTLTTLLEIYAIIDEFKLKHNAAIMSYLLSGLSKNNLTMEHAISHLKRQREKRKDRQGYQGQTELQRKIQEEMSRRYENMMKAKRDKMHIDQMKKKETIKVVSPQMQEQHKHSEELQPLQKGLPDVDPSKKKADKSPVGRPLEIINEESESNTHQSMPTQQEQLRQTTATSNHLPLILT